MSSKAVRVSNSGDVARELVPLVASLLIALLLLVAAAFKIVDWMQLLNAARDAEAVTGTAGVAPSRWKLALPFAEAIIAAGIVVFHRRAWVWALATIMFSSMAGYVFLLMVRGEASCGCFGSMSPPPVVMFTVDALLALLCLSLATRWWGFAQGRGMVLTVAGAGSIIGASVANATTEAPVDEEFEPLVALRDVSVFQPALEVGHDVPVYLVYIYQRECPACQQHYPGMHRFTQATAEHPDIRGLLLEVSDLQEIAEAEGKFLHKGSWEEVPVTLIMQNGQIREQFGRADTPSPRATYERLTGKSYDELLDRTQAQEQELLPFVPVPNPELVPSGFGPNADPDAVIEATADRALEQRDLVAKLRTMDRFSEIFDDEVGGVRHVMYAHTNCATCIEYRKYLLEMRDMLSDRLVFHPVMRSLLEDDGISDEEWGGVHAMLLFDGGVLQHWYGEGEITNDLPLDLHDEFTE